MLRKFLSDDDDNIYIHFPGTTGFIPSYDESASIAWEMMSDLSKYIASVAHPTLFHSSTRLSMTELKDAPEACLNFKKKYEALTTGEGDRFYVNDSGKIGLRAWVETALFVKKFLERRLKINGGRPINVFGTCHSHGGNKAMALAMMCQTDQLNVRFFLDTIETPLSLFEPILMPSNVLVLNHFWHKEDKIASGGALMWQAEQSMGNDSLGSIASIYAVYHYLYQLYHREFTRRVEDVYIKLHGSLEGFPEWWKSHEITDKVSDAHNAPVKDKKIAQDICDLSLRVLSAYKEAHAGDDLTHSHSPTKS
jgi:hypothetical protein